MPTQRDRQLWYYTRQCRNKAASASGMIPCYLEDGPVALDNPESQNAVCVGCNRFRENIDAETSRLQQ